MQLQGDRLRLHGKPGHGLSLPIDIFFESMAEQCLDRAVAIVLSGTGSNGTRRLAAVHANGGFVFVQDPLSAKFDGMPRSAMASGFVDDVAPAAELAARLVRHLSLPRPVLSRLRQGAAEAERALSPQPLEGIFDLLADGTGIDFRECKPNTVMRRIERRMQVLQSASRAEYRQRLLGSADEQALLRRELLIPVTRFFRDAEAFEALAEQVIAPLVQARHTGEPLRVWVACCATGEEAYTLAILFAEALQRLNVQRAVKIFATDAEQQHLEQAAGGQYPQAVAAEVSAERLERFFVRHPGAFLVKPEIRQMVIFARHNLLVDPPFTRMDLVSCRNALIYLQPPAQERALRRLQFALSLQGHLLLGPSESLGGLHAEFATVAPRHKIFRLLRRSRVLGVAPSQGLPRRSVRRTVTDAPSAAEALAASVAAGRQQLQRSYVPPTLLVGPGRELLHVYGDASGFLRLGEGMVTLDVLKLLPRELAWATGLLLQPPGPGHDPTQPQRSAPLRLPLPSDGSGAPGAEALVVIVAQRLAPAAPSQRTGTAATMPPPEAHPALDADTEPAPAGAEDPGALVLLSFETATGQHPLAAEAVDRGIDQQAIIDSLPEHVAVLDAQGTIQLVNKAWRRFASEGGDPELRSTGTGTNCLKVCAQAAQHDASARHAHEGLLRALERRADAFTLQHPCHSDTQRRWFLMHVGRVDHAAGGVVVSHVNISEWVLRGQAAGALS